MVNGEWMALVGTGAQHGGVGEHPVSSGIQRYPAVSSEIQRNPVVSSGIDCPSTVVNCFAYVAIFSQFTSRPFVCCEYYQSVNALAFRSRGALCNSWRHQFIFKM
jgi:hypothetical protein